MGWYVSFVAFNRPPEIDTLQGIDWLTSWRLFHEPETGAWFFEGQSDTEAITFQEEIKTKALGLTDDQTALLKGIETSITEQGGDKTLFDVDGAQIAMALSRALDQPVAHFSAYDEGGDSCFIFDAGRLIRGRLEIDWNKALSFDARGRAELEWLYPEGVSDDDPGFVNSRTMFQIGLEEADAFFDRHTLANTLTFDNEIEPGQFLLKAQKGAPAPTALTPHEELTQLLGLSPTFEDMLEAFSPVVDAVLDSGFPDAPNPHRHEMDNRSLGCCVYVSYLRKRSSENAAANARLHAFLLDLNNYAKALRPAPDFRKSSTDFRRWQRKLSADWLRQKSGDPWFRRLFR
ncbi:MAG: hypothetical protein AAFX86_09105 [Pseudomonadota bacterium]